MAKRKAAAMLPELLKNFFSKPDTVKYPFEKLTPTPEFRGRMVWEADKCIGCQACVRDCPTGVIDIVKAAPDVKKFNATYRMYLCIFCGQCVDSCPVHCIHWTSAFELAADKRQTIQYDCSAEAIELARKQAAEKAAAAAAKATATPAPEPPPDTPAA
ncbi:MAG TPA: 4Fe-4S binding protein [bacterium]|nr:4Fe-4S binding protein [bacterium]